MPNKKAVIETKKGTIEVELFADEVPGTVANFEKLANASFYDGTKFHRVIPNFMIQGGDPYSKTGKGPVGTGGPGYTIKCETQKNTHKHVAGTLSMAHAGKDTGGSQFFICHSPQRHLDGLHTVFGQVPKGTFPFQLHVYGLLEQMGRWARAQGKDSVRFTALTSATATSGGYLVKRGGDPLVILFDEGQYAGVGPFTFRLDRQGHITWLTGKGSTLQVEVQRVASVPMAQAGPMFANRPLGQLSPRDTARASVGGVDVWVDYGRPQKRGREIFGNVVPWSAVWRTGANAATQFSTMADLVIGGATVPAGKYTLWTLPTPTGWKLIINIAPA